MARLQALTLVNVEEDKNWGITMPSWCFKSAAQRTRISSTNHWYWQIDTQNTDIAITSPRLFASIEECIEDARGNGFRGEVDVPDELTHPALITCEEGDYVHGIVQRSWTARQQARPN